MYQLPTQPLSIFQVIRQSFSLYHAAFKRILSWVLVIGILDTVFALGINLMHAGTQASGQPLGSVMVLTLAWTLVFLIVMLMLISALISSIYHVMHNQQTTMSAEFAIGLRTWWRILLGVIMIAIVMAILVGLLRLMLHMPTPSAAMVFITALISLAVLLLVIYLIVRFFAWIFLVVTQQQGVISAFKESFTLVRHSWWLTFGFLIVAVAMQVIVVLIILAIDRAWASVAGDMLWLQLLGGFVVGVLLTLVLSWMYSAQLMQIYNLSLRYKQSEH